MIQGLLFDDDSEYTYSCLLGACQKYEKSAQTKPNNFELLYNWGIALLYIARIRSKDAIKCLPLACEKFKKALEIKPKDHKSLKNYAVSLSKLARLKSGNVYWFNGTDKLFS